MSNGKHFHFRAGDKMPKSPFSIVRKSADKGDIIYPIRFTTTDSEYFSRRVHTENNDDDEFQVGRAMQTLGFGYIGNSKCPSNIKMPEKDSTKIGSVYLQKKQNKSDGLTIKVPKTGVIIATNELHQNISIFTQGKQKRDSSKILVTEPGVTINSKDKVIKKENKKLFDRLLLTKEKGTKDDTLKNRNFKQNKDRLLFGSSEAKQKQYYTQAANRDKPESIQFKQKHNPYTFGSMKKGRQVLANTENIQRTSKVLNTEPCEVTKPEIQILEKVGEGTFGQVFKAKMGNKLVAIKKVYQDKKYKNRQLEILHMIRSDFVLHVLDTYYTEQKGSKGEGPKDYLNVVMEYYQQNLYEASCEADEALSPLQIKLLMYQLFRGLVYIHSLNICHRDIKPQNLLVNRKNARLVICDFGSAKKLVKGEANIAYICSRCYRAPELIFGCTNYTTMIDIWSAGCVLLQLLSGQPFFIGDSNMGQLVQIIKVLGTPSKTEVINMNPTYDLDDYKFPKIRTKPWKQIFPEIDVHLQSLLKQLMIYSPKERLNAAEALCHEYFDELREQSVYSCLKQKKQVVNLFNFTKQQLRGNQHLIPKLIPEWHQDHQLDDF